LKEPKFSSREGEEVAGNRGKKGSALYHHLSLNTGWGRKAFEGEKIFGNACSKGGENLSSKTEDREGVRYNASVTIAP